MQEFKRKKKKPRVIWVDYTSPEFKMAPTPLTEADFNEIYEKPAYKAKKMLLQIHNTYNKAYTPTTNY